MHTAYTAASPDQRHETGAFDIIGDVHGCYDELQALLAKLGYLTDPHDPPPEAPPGRRLIFVGDLTDRGPEPVRTLRLVMALVRAEVALCVVGNHDDKLRRWLAGNAVSLNHGLAETSAAVAAEAASFRRDVASFITGLPLYLWLDKGALLVTHAGIRAEMIGRSDSEVRSFCLFGDVSGEVDEAGLTIRGDWGKAYRGAPAVVYGHDPVTAPVWINNTLCIDTGCCFGGRLTALRWPERELVSVPAVREYRPSRRPFRVLVAE